MHLDTKYILLAAFTRIALAQAHAKLNLRTLVLEEDAVIAVLLCENSITLKHGESFSEPFKSIHLQQIGLIRSLATSDRFNMLY